jgi:hypothetical protein
MGYLDTALSALSPPKAPVSHKVVVGDPLRTNVLTYKGSLSPPAAEAATDWRAEVAGWPRERWTRWRQTATGCLGYLKHPPTAQDIRDADRFAYYVTAPDGDTHD